MLYNASAYLNLERTKENELLLYTVCIMFTIPNVLTSSNLFFGCAALVSLSKAEPGYCILFMVLAGIADFLDGFIAKKLKQNSELGLQLDSLSDVVSFGVVPGMICFGILETSQSAPSWMAYAGFLLSLMAAFRLARFNVTSLSTSSFFTGLPVPANGLFFAGLLYASEIGMNGKTIAVEPWLLLSLITLFSWLMISSIKIIKYRFDPVWLKKYGFILFLELLSLLSFFWIGAAALSLAVLLHLVLSLIFTPSEN